MTNKQRKERFHKLEICDQMAHEIINLKPDKVSLALKLAKKKDLKEISKTRKKLKKQKFKEGK